LPRIPSTAINTKWLPSSAGMGNKLKTPRFKEINANNHNNSADFSLIGVSWSITFPIMLTTPTGPVIVSFAAISFVNILPILLNVSLTIEYEYFIDSSTAGKNPLESSKYIPRGLKYSWRIEIEYIVFSSPFLLINNSKESPSLLLIISLTSSQFSVGIPFTEIIISSTSNTGFLSLELGSTKVTFQAFSVSSNIADIPNLYEESFSGDNVYSCLVIPSCSIVIRLILSLSGIKLISNP